MKVAVIYRCCDSELNSNEFKAIRPEWFDKRVCFLSLYQNIKLSDFDISFRVLHDGDDKGFLSFILKNMYSDKIGFLDKIDFKSNLKSLLKTFEIADSCFDYCDIVYFIEDDYLHVEGALDVIINGTKTYGLTTGFDHLDRYKRVDDISRGNEYIAYSSSTNRHWRTAESTTCTWAVDKNTWNLIKEDVKTYALSDRELFRHLYKKGIRLWTPIPGVSTTMDYTTFSPSIDWKLVNDFYKKLI